MMTQYLLSWLTLLDGRVVERKCCFTVDKKMRLNCPNSVPVGCTLSRSLNLIFFICADQSLVVGLVGM